MIASCPAISTFLLQTSALPLRPWLARFAVVRRDNKGVARAEKLPMDFSGDTEAEAVEAAREWWEQQQANIETKLAAVKRAQDARRVAA